MLRFCAPQALIAGGEWSLFDLCGSRTFYRCVLRCVTALILITATTRTGVLSIRCHTGEASSRSLATSHGEAKAKSVTAPAGKPSVGNSVFKEKRRRRRGRCVTFSAPPRNRSNKPEIQGQAIACERK